MHSTKKIICIISLMIFSVGCAHYENDLAQEGKAAVEIIPPKVMVKISNVHVLGKEDGLKVIGSVERTGLGIMNGHIDVAVLSPEKTVLGLASTDYSPTFQRRSVRRRAVRPSSFSAKFLGSLLAGSVVKVAFHPEELDNKISCITLLGLSISS